MGREVEVEVVVVMCMVVGGRGGRAPLQVARISST